MHIRPRLFCAGLFLVCASTLLLQIAQTRLLSVMGRYYLAFFAISMAMFGMTAGALWIYWRRDRYSLSTLFADLARMTLGYAIAIFVCVGFELASVVSFFDTAMSIFVWLKIILLLAPPYVFAGMAVSLALTRSPFPIGLVYGVDLAGAATGCLIAIALLDLVDTPSALIGIAALAALAATAFAAAQRDRRPQSGAWWSQATTGQAALVTAVLVLLCVANASTLRGLQPLFVKGVAEEVTKFEFVKWNTFSRVVSYFPRFGYPFMWGPSPIAPKDLRIEQRYLNIDGEAATSMPRFSGDLDTLQFLRFDITTFAYSLRNHGRAAIIGVGGGRDMLSAYYFGFRDITGIELNPIFIDLLTNPNRFRSFSGLADLPNVRFVVDDARSWFARTTERFDLIQMSLVDTWASTGAGGFTLSENGLYTVEGWRHFLHALTPHGIFTVSRWYASGSEYETARLLSLAIAALQAEFGVTDPQAHIFLAGQEQLGTLVVSAAPLTPAEIATLRTTAERYHYKILASPDQPPASEILRSLLEARSIEELTSQASTYLLDVSPATDARPFFFNMLRLDPLRIEQTLAFALHSKTGVVRGNLHATGTLVLIIGLSAVLVTATIVLPLRHSVRIVERRLAVWGTAYFLLIGIGFMFVEIGLIQRISVFLGHPVYALSIGLFSIILATGIGSFASERIVLDTAPRFILWTIILAAYIAVLPSWFPILAAHFESAEIAVRALVCVVAILPAGVLMGFGFPTGMRLVNAIDSRPTPWFWGVNGAAGVLASGIAVGCSVSTSVDVTVRLGAVAYLSLAAAGVALLARVGGSVKRQQAPTPTPP
jgi:spermidine synthase